jgi:hypothetical protein
LTSNKALNSHIRVIQNSLIIRVSEFTVYGKL